STTVETLVNTTPLGNATPVFLARQDFTTGTNPTSVAVADFNGDGKPDLVVANNVSNSVSVLLNTTLPGVTVLSFASHQDFAVGVGSKTQPDLPVSVVVGDVNEDGRPDLIVTNSGSNTVSVLLDTTAPGAAVPTFTTAQNFTTGGTPAPL